jgi:hypothetical protein
MYFGYISLTERAYGLVIEPVQYTNIVKTVMSAGNKFAGIANSV